MDPEKEPNEDPENNARKSRKAWIFTAFGIILLAITGTALLRWTGLGLPSGLNPFGPPDLNSPAGFLTRIQLSSLKRNPMMCFEALDRAGLSYVRSDERPITEGCGLESGVRLTGNAPRFAPSAESSCALAAAYFSASVRRTLNLGTFSCRQIRGGGRMSEHATANAIDISGFVLSDGRQIALLNNWNDESAEGAFLREVAAGSCRFFNVVFGPDDNAAHADHFHFDMGPFRRCRYD